MPITQVAAQFSMTRQGITKHLKVLNDADLVVFKTSGRERYCSAKIEPLQEVKKWLSFYDTFWDTKLNDLDNYLNQTPEV